MGTTLIFPCCVREGGVYAEAARDRGEQVVAASSLANDETAESFKTWFYLPPVHDESFVSCLDEAVVKYAIARIFCPVPVAHVVLCGLIADGKLSVPLIGEMAIDRHEREHRELMATAVARHAFIQEVSERRSPLTPIDVAAVLRQALGGFGQSNENKIAAMIATFADAPHGDIVEIGVLTGRSACVLALMAQRHGIGPVLAVDPWSGPLAVQRDLPPALQAWANAWDMSSAFESFVVALLPMAEKGKFNYLAMPSREAHAAWSRRTQVDSPHFGNVRYGGAIAVLHIDGNHDYACVREDCALWVPYLLPGGWLILDDYVLLQGDGPRRVGDALLKERAADISRAFVCGKALFIKLGG